ncbi:MAG: TRAP transporter small permease subunit [Lautropia sp.]
MADSAFVRAVDRLADALAVVASVMLTAAALIIVWNVIDRAMGASTYWQIEAAVYLMVAALFLGSPYCLKTKGHVGVDLLSHYLPARHARPLEIAVAVVGLLVCVYLVWVGAEFAIESFLKDEHTESTWAPAKWPLLATLPLGLALTALQYVAELIRLRRAPATSQDLPG